MKQKTNVSITNAENINAVNSKVHNLQKGITLISLVITIIILLILGGVAISIAVDSNGLFARARKAAEEWNTSVATEEATLNDYINITEISENGYNDVFKVNEPKLEDGMIPVYYEETADNATEGKWKVANKENKNNQWYDYDNKKWANIVTVEDKDKDLRTAEEGTEIPMEKITTFFVWIPRYAYSIVDGYLQPNTEKVPETNAKSPKIDVTFLKGNTNIGVDGKSYQSDYDETQLSAGNVTPKIVHPGFKWGNNELTGIWVAKFEASGENKDNDAVGNMKDGEKLIEPDETTYVKIKPSVISWRSITVGESQYRCKNMVNATEHYGFSENANSHLIKSKEWGTVSYLCYSKYGYVPMTNDTGTRGDNSVYNKMTGAGPKYNNGIQSEYDNFGDLSDNNGHMYFTQNGMSASTTGNVYGIYDMASGSYDRVAAFLDSKFRYYSEYGNPTSNTSVKYFDSKTNELLPQYANDWDKFEVSDEERNDKILVGDGIYISKEELCFPDTEKEYYNEENYNNAYKRITEITFSNIKKIKGIGIGEMANRYIYNYLVNGKNSWCYGAAAGHWNSQRLQLGSLRNCFLDAGSCSYAPESVGRGVLLMSFGWGAEDMNASFRPVLAF